jgi:TRAP-type C4-dicarboxylate transport system substrate-binding protein
LLVLAIAATLAVGPACGGSVTGKAGGPERVRRPVVLAMASGVTFAREEDQLFFAAQVWARSRHTLRIALEGLPTSARTLPIAAQERLMVDGLRRGKLPMAWVATRAWEAQGVTSFEALWAPFFITDAALLRRVLNAPVAQAMLAGTESRGVVSLALVPKDLRRVLGRRRALTDPLAFRGARIAATSPTTGRALRALGATPLLDVPDPTAALRTGAVDGVETGGFRLVSNGFAQLGAYLVVNVVLFPRVDVINVSRHVFAGLTGLQRTALRDAARQTAARFADLSGEEANDLQTACDDGARLVTATSAQLVQLRRAVRSVDDRLARDPSVAGYLRQIEAIKRTTRGAPRTEIPARCAG